MNIEMIRVCLSPLSYLRIRHEAKYWADWVYPAVLALISTQLLMKYGASGVIIGDDGLLSKILIVSSILPGFYIASLAAIATFNRPDIDELMKAPTPVIMQRIGGKKSPVELTRRRFLANLFAFLCFESIVILVICVFASLLGQGALVLVPVACYQAFKAVFTFGVLLLFWQMLCGTFLGLYYLGDRLYRPY